MKQILSLPLFCVLVGLTLAGRLSAASISEIPDQTIPSGDAIAALPFTLSDFEPQESMRIMAANTTSGNGQSYEGPGTRIFQGLRPDVVLIQEFNIGNKSQAETDAWVESTFGSEFSYYVEPAGSIPNGVISSYPILNSGTWDDGDDGITDRGFAWAQIDIPGDKDLWAISVHLKASSGSTNASRRQIQAETLQTLVEQYVPADAYLVVGGDLNTRSYAESCLDVLGEFVDVLDPRPADQAGDPDTNSGRSSPYDWVMAEDELDVLEVPTTLGSVSFSNGLVFDSRVYNPLSEVAPVQSGDSGVSGMQHMAVLRTFAVSAPENIVVTVTTSNPTLFPPSNLILTGAGNNWTIASTPLLGQTGTATITVEATDGVLTASETFTIEVEPEPPPLTTLTADSSVVNGSIAGAGSYQLGTTATLTAIPAVGYLFTGWTGDASGTANPLSVVMDGDKTIGAIFVVVEQALTIDPSITNGSIAGAGVYNQGATATLTASPSFGYAFVGWTGDASGADNPLSLVMDGDKAIGAIFTPTASGAIDYSVQGLNGVAIADSEGVAITSGSAMAFGYFPLTLTAPLTQTSSWDEVLGVGTENEFVTLFSGIMGYETGGVTYDGVFAGGEQQYVDSSGKQMVMVISNASVLTQGTEVGIFSSLNESWTIPALAAPVSALLAVDVNSADLILYGNQGIGDSAFPDQSYGFLDNLNTDIFRDPDSDGDGLIDAVETNTGVYLSATDTGTDPENVDSDEDGLSDGVETGRGTYVSATDTGTDPNRADSDNDGLSDKVETGRGTYISATDTGTDPNQEDTDEDNLLDGVETKTGLYISAMDTGTDPNLADGDGDGLLDGVETATGIYVSSTDTGTNPNSADSDNDGLVDGAETNSGIYLSGESTGTSPVAADSSGDGISDGEALLSAFDPNVDYQPVLDCLDSRAAAGDGRFGLYTKSTLMDMNLGTVQLQRAGNTSEVILQIQFKYDPDGTAWVEDGEETIIMEMSGPQNFVQLEILEHE